MGFEINITERFDEYIKEDVIYNIENINDNSFLDNLLMINEITEKIVQYLIRNNEFLKILHKKVSDIEEEEETIQKLIEEEENWVIEYIEKDWQNFIKTHNLKNLADIFLMNNPEYGNELWNYFIESEFSYEDKKSIPFFFRGEFLKEIPMIGPDKNDEIYLYSFIEYLKTNKNKILGKFLDDLEKYYAYDIFESFFIKIESRITSCCYSEYLTIDVKPFYYLGYDYDLNEEYSASEFAKDVFDNEEDWEEMINKGGWTKEEIMEKLEYVYSEVKEFAEKIEELYEDVMNYDYHNNSKYSLEHSFNDFRDKLLDSIEEVVKNKKQIEFFKSINKPYNVFNPFFVGHYDKIFYKINILKKYKNLFTEEEKEHLKLLSKELISKDSSTSVPEYKNGLYKKYVNWEEVDSFLVNDKKKSGVFGIRYFGEDKKKLFKFYSKKINKYEEAYKNFINIIKNNDFSKIISLLSNFNGKEQKKCIAYINSRLFEDYFNCEKKSFIKNCKDSIIQGAYFLSPLYPSEFAVFLVAETYEKMSSKDVYQTFYYDKYSNNEKKILKEFKKIADKESTKKLIKKTLAFCPLNKNNEKYNNYEGFAYLENEFIRPLSLCENPLKEKANLRIAKKFIEMKIKEFENKRAFADKSIKKLRRDGRAVEGGGLENR